jgi:hypothetical protein
MFQPDLLMNEDSGLGQKKTLIRASAAAAAPFSIFDKHFSRSPASSSSPSPSLTWTWTAACMFVPFNLSQAIDVISDTYQVEGIIRRFSVGRRKDYKEEEVSWEMESIRVFFLDLT